MHAGIGSGVSNPDALRAPRGEAWVFCPPKQTTLDAFDDQWLATHPPACFANSAPRPEHSSCNQSSREPRERHPENL